MKILILNPPSENTLPEFPDEHGESYIDTEDFGYFPPLGALYVLSYLEKYTTGHDLFFKDCVAERIKHKDLAEIINQIQPDVVGITSFTIALIDVCYAAKTIREIVPRAHICLGGHHPIAFPYQAAKLPEFDSIVVGEGEKAFLELVTALEQNLDITKIRGVYTSDSIEKWLGSTFNDNIFLSSVMVPPAYIDDIDSLPIPNRAFIRHIDYKSIVGVTNKLATIITSRGCPYKCIFCDVPYKQYRKRSILKVVDEVAECLQMGYKEIHFYDDLFNITPERVIEFCDEIDKRGLKFPWDFRGRVNTVTKESLSRAKKAGCRLISFGVETGSDAGLTFLKKGITIRKIKEVFHWCRELQIKTIADFMIGLPFEKSREDVLKNIDFLIDLDPDYPQIAILCLYPNTNIFQQAIDKGLVNKSKWEEFSIEPSKDFKIDHWEEFLSTQELVHLQKEGYKRFYLRPSYVLRNILSTRTLYEFKSKAKGAFKLLGLNLS
jgi:radical SAM superfamily enzyme YgiQ (UPF0313 family)